MKRLSFSYRFLQISAIVFLLLSLLPLFLLGRYAVPAADDFSYGAAAHLAFLQDGSFFSAAAAAAGKTVETYFSWQGTFSAVFLMALQPAVFSLRLYALTPLIMTGVFVGGSFLFCRRILGNLFLLRPALCDIISSLICALSVQLLPSPVQGLFWYNGAVYYMVFHGLLLCACAAACSLLQRGGRLRCALLSFLCLLLGGGNYVTALSAVILLAAAVLLLLIIRKGSWKRLILPGTVLLLAFLLNICAPGNAVRQAAQENTPGVIAAILQSFLSGLSYAGQWFSLPILGMLLLLCPLVWPQLKGSAFSFSCPLLVTLFSYCFFSAMFCPPIYAMGNVGDKRLLNIVYCTYLLLLTINWIYWLGWAAKRRVESAGSAIPSLPFCLAALFFVCCLGLSAVSGTGFCSLGACSTLRSGEAREYYECAQQRFSLLEAPETRDAVLAPFSVYPYLLYFDDISSDPTDWKNVDMATYFGLDSVRLG